MVALVMSLLLFSRVNFSAVVPIEILSGVCSPQRKAKAWLSLEPDIVNVTRLM